MSVLNLRNVPEDLVRRLHVRAAEFGKASHFHEFCVDCLKAGLDEMQAAPRIATPPKPKPGPVLDTSPLTGPHVTQYSGTQPDFEEPAEQFHVTEITIT